MSERNGWIQAADGIAVLFVGGVALRVSITSESLEDAESAIDDLTERLTEVSAGLSLWTDMPHDFDAWELSHSGPGWVEVTAPLTVLSRQPTHDLPNFNNTARENVCVEGDRAYTLCDMHMEQEASYERRAGQWGYTHGGAVAWTPVPAPTPLRGAR